MPARSVITVLGLLLIPAPLLACPVCGLAGVEDNLTAYAVMTLVLSALPLAMIGGVVTWIYRRSRHASVERGGWSAEISPGRTAGRPASR